MARLFVAVWPPADVLDRLEALPRPAVPGCRWTTRAQWHVTLRFLGEADPDAVAAALATLPSSSSLFDVAAAPPAYEAVLGPRAGFLGSGVLMLPVAGLDGPAASVERSTSGIGRPSPHPFTGHLTLARIKGSSASLDLDSLALSARWPVTSVALVASKTLPTGPTYTTLSELALG